MKHRYILALLLCLTQSSWGLEVVNYKNGGPIQGVTVRAPGKDGVDRIFLDGKKIKLVRRDPRYIELRNDVTETGVLLFRVIAYPHGSLPLLGVMDEDGLWYEIGLNLEYRRPSTDVVIKEDRFFTPEVAYPTKIVEAKHPYNDPEIKKMCWRLIDKVNTREAKRITFKRNPFSADRNAIFDNSYLIDNMIVGDFRLENKKTDPPLDSEAFFKRFEKDILGKRIIEQSPHKIHFMAVLHPKTVERMTRRN